MKELNLGNLNKSSTSLKHQPNFDIIVALKDEIMIYIFMDMGYI